LQHAHFSWNGDTSLSSSLSTRGVKYSDFCRSPRRFAHTD
jgi:hypothetical protein